jgi:formamidopyrimidine-DNA glycosylase
MPELPEVETVRRGLAARVVGRPIIRVDQRRLKLRIPLPDNFPARVQGRKVASLGRRAKYLLWYLDDGNVLVVHLGMSGRMSIVEADGSDDQVPGNGRHDHVVFHLDDGTSVVFNDPRRFGLMTLIRETDLPGHPFFKDLGPEPLSNGFNGDVLSAAVRGRRTPIKAALLDQKVVAGLGNIYVCEALYRAGISPRRMAASVAGKRAERLARHIRDVLAEAIEAGGSTLRDYVQADGALGYFQYDHAVYGREGEPCPDCTCPQGVQRIVQSNRSTFYCSVRQR